MTTHLRHFLVNSKAFASGIDFAHLVCASIFKSLFSLSSLSVSLALYLSLLFSIFLLTISLYFSLSLSSFLSLFIFFKNYLSLLQLFTTLAILVISQNVFYCSRNKKGTDFNLSSIINLNFFQQKN